ncbi:MAG: T9SS type A sorting domain-containing protein, partial [Flavobacteriales bacterium]|nr:T9SS type A sorting domain-containing protein [Flavobacteriales bacterium]
ATATGLPAGTYTVIVTGSDNCMASITVTITEPAPLSAVKSNTEPTCFGDCDGSAALTINGGTAPFVYLWDDPSAQTNALASGLCDGTYKVIYTDANSCIDSTNVTITEPIDIVASITGTVQNVCLGGCIGTATVGVVSGGIPPFAYLWDDLAAQTTATATGLCAGSYIGSVVDLNGCTSNSVAVITEPGGTNTTMSAIDATCGGTDGSANVVATGGVAPYTYSWNDPASQTNATATAIGFGVYTVIVTDFNGCTTVDSVSVNNIGAPSLTAVVDNNVSCFGNFDGAATATATTGSPPITYLWNDPATQTNATANGLGSGSYTVTASDINGCSASAFLTITEPAQLTSTIAVTDILCNGDCDGSATLTVSGGTAPFMYLWDDPSAQTNALASGLCANAYVGTVTDNNGCILTVTDTVNEPGLLVVTSTSVNELCSAGDGQGTAAVSGGVSPYAYLWSDPAAQTSATAVNLSAGAYAVAVTDGNNCTTIDSVTIANTGVSIASLTGINPGCGACDGSVTVVASGGTGPYTYLWNDPAPQTSSTASSLCQGTYTVMVTDTNGCTKTDSTTLIQPPLFTVSSSTQNLVCGGVCDGTASLTITGGTPPYTYLWDDPAAQTNAIATDLCANTFTCNISDTAGCSAVETVTITEPGALVVSVITIPASPGGSDGSATASTVGGTGPMAFLWDDSGAQTTATATGLSTGTYNVTVTDANGCTVTEIASISDGTGIWDYQLGVRFEVYPNPTTGVVVFDLELLEVSGITIQILDIVGGLVYQTAHTSVHLFKRETDLSALANGIYLVRLSTEKGSVERRIVIAK